MKASHFIQSKLTEIVNWCPWLRVAYEFDKFDNSHIVQIWPKLLFYHHSFVELETALQQEFIKLYPNHLLTFTTEGELYEVENPTFSLTGAAYHQPFAFFNPISLSLPDTQILTDKLLAVANSFGECEEVTNLTCAA
jgi:hypothetical protein